MSVTEPNVTVSDIGTFSTWYNDKDQLHREDGPAWIQHNNDGHIYEVWYKNDMYHRIGAPASIIRRNGLVLGETWYLYGEEMEEEQYKKVMRTCKRAIAKLKSRLRKTYVEILKDTDICDEINLYNIIADYVI